MPDVVVGPILLALQVERILGHLVNVALSPPHVKLEGGVKEPTR